MKRIISLSMLCAILATSGIVAADEPKPITKVMLARLAWIQSLSRDTAYSNYEGISKTAGELAAQTRKVGDAAPAPFNKEKNLAISDLASGMAAAAANKDGVAVSAKLGEILGTCAICHAKLRDSK